MTWDEVEAGGLTQLRAPAVLERIAEHGDLYATTLDDSLRTALPR